MKYAHTSKTLIDIFDKWVEEKPDEILYTFLTDQNNCKHSSSYGELRKKSTALASHIQRVAKPPDSALLLIPPGLGYIKAFIACLYARVTPIPLYPPQMNSLLQRIQDVAIDSGATIVLTDIATKKTIQEKNREFSYLKSLHWIEIDNVKNSDSNYFQQTKLYGDDPAFLQYTSGSTSAPKGVILTHANLIHNLNHIYTCFGHNSESKGVIWLPPYHDMGLIGGILQPLFGGFPVYLMAPASFLKNPASWLKAISHYKATTSGGNNFSYELCARRISKSTIQELDLSSWKVAFNGAEPVRAETIELFSKVFKPAGFNRSAFYPCYGLAEATLIVSGKKTIDPIKTHTIDKTALQKSKIVPVKINGKTFVSNGSCLKDQKILIVDPNTSKPCSGKIGEIWIKGDSIARGYWNKKELSQQTFQAYTADTNEGPFLRSGDLGYLHMGELYVTGRLKDLIIIRGRNYYPQDIEVTVGKIHRAFVPNSGAAFSIDVDGQERLIITQEVLNLKRIDWKNVIDSVRKAVMEEHQIQPHAILLLPRKSIAKTSSGKIRRFACKKAYLENCLSPVSKDTLPGLSEKKDISFLVTADQVLKTITGRKMDAKQKKSQLIAFLKERSAGILSIEQERISDEKSLLHYGLDSVLAVEFIHMVESNLQVDLSFQKLLSEGSLNAIADEILLKVTDRKTGRDQNTEPTAGPPSSGQKGLLYLQRLDPANCAYNLYYAVNINSPLDIDALYKTIQLLVKKHPVLRTNFIMKDNKMRQLVTDEIIIDFKEKDISALSDDQVDRIIETEAHQSFDLTRDVLFRIRLFHGRDHKKILLFTIHHIITDFWSLSLLFSQIGRVYTKLVNNEAPELSALSLSYIDYVLEQNNFIESKSGDEILNFWKDKLAGKLPKLELPFDYSRKPVQSFKGAVREFNINSRITQELKEIATLSGSTMYMVLLAAFKIFLYRITGQVDIIVGTPLTGRQKAEYSRIIGYFVNPAAIRTQLDKSAGFLQNIDQVKKNVINVLDKQAFPFSLLSNKLQIEIDPGRSPIFDVMFVYQKAPHFQNIDLVPFALNLPGAQAIVGNLDVTLRPIRNLSTQFDLTLQMGEVENRIQAAFQYCTDLFDSETIKRLITYFCQCIRELTFNPKMPISTIPVIPSQEYKKIVHTWNPMENKPCSKETITSLFEKQVLNKPDVQALIFQDRILSFSKLNRKANQWAHYLKSQGVGPEKLIGIMLDRTPEMVITILGVLKAGGGYVPINPELPEKRINYILGDSAVPLVITKKSFIEKIKNFTGKIIDINAIDINRFSVENPPQTGKGIDLAYIIYTSGSTGNPKGVMVEQRNVLNLMSSLDHSIGVYTSATVTALNNISFDISVLDLWWSLTRGLRVLLLSENAALEKGENNLFNLARIHKPGILQCTPPLLRIIFQQSEAFKALQSVHTYILGGEPIPPELVHRLKKNTNARLFNMYGPTETTVYSTYYEVPDNFKQPVLIGRPHTNNSIYILDENLQSCPIGVKGEIHIGGKNVSRGYLNKQELTDEAFIPNPFNLQEGNRIYKTGDLARFLTDGNIELIGRNDFQVKIRGHRIELGEIESRLLQHKAITNVVVTATDFQKGGRRIVAYIIVNPGMKGPTINDIRNYLGQELPDYMLPSYVIELQNIPLTPNGKTDFKSLPAPRTVSQASEFIVPKAQSEKKVAEVWKKILNIEKISIKDNFFDLGGHSLLMPEIQEQLNNHFQTNISIVALFEYPTIMELAKFLSGISKKDEKNSTRKGIDRAQKQLNARRNRKRQQTLS